MMDEATAAIARRYPIGTRLREAHPPHETGRLFHVRGHVDGRLVISVWSPRKGWLYQVEREHAVTCGLFSLDATDEPCDG